MLEIAAIRVGIGGDEWTEPLLVLDPARGDVFGNSVIAERFTHDLDAPSEMSTEDGMCAMCVAKGASGIALLSS